jgi:ABC-type cobalamin/Fe3+-siderophores transport system ATPase subunit
MMGGSLSLSGVRVRRSGRSILDIERLDIFSGGFVGVLGPNGAGKTTLLQVCTGLIRPGRGSVIVGGEDFSRLSAWHQSRLRKRIGYIPQATQYNADLPFTLREVVAMGRASVRPMLVPLNAEDRGIVDDWIGRVGLSDRRDQTFRSLSGGQQQKALIARAMAQEPDILLLDEPCANLDFIWRQRISEMIEELYRQTHVTVVMVSHETAVFPPACDRLLVLSQGRVVADGTPHDVLCAGMLQRTFEAG